MYWVGEGAHQASQGFQGCQGCLAPLTALSATMGWGGSNKTPWVHPYVCYTVYTLGVDLNHTGTNNPNFDVANKLLPEFFRI